MTAGCFDDDETNAGRRAGGLGYMSNIDLFVTIEIQRHGAESIQSDSGDKVDVCSEAGTTHSLVGAFASVVDAIAAS